MSNDDLSNIQLSEKDLADLAALDGELPNFHTVLEVWREVLRPAATEATKRVTAGWASKMVASYPEVTFADMNEVRDRYYAKIGELNQILLDEIATDSEALTWSTPEEDAAQNAAHYKNLLRDWQIRVLSWELEWDCTDPHAGVELAAISEVHKMFFGQTGLTAFLDNIKLEFTEADQQALANDLEAFRQEATGE